MWPVAKETSGNPTRPNLSTWVQLLLKVFNFILLRHCWCHMKLLRIVRSQAMTYQPTLRAYGHDPLTWKNPLEFNPDRFLNTNVSELYRGKDQCRLIPFGVGKKIMPRCKSGASYCSEHRCQYAPFVRLDCRRIRTRYLWVRRHRRPESETSVWFSQAPPALRIGLTTRWICRAEFHRPYYQMWNMR